MKIKSLACALIALGACGIASAADSYNIAATATVNALCKFTQAAGQTLTFTNTTGGIDPSIATDATASTTVTYHCTKGTSPTLFTASSTQDTGGNHVVKNGTVGSMIYTVALTPGGAGDGFGTGSTDKSLGVAGTITQASFGTAAAGTYTDTLTVTIAP
jgi:spore coat protein U-like protein